MSLRIAFFGQAPFGRDVLVRLLDAGHDVAAVYAPPERARPDPLAEEARSRGLALRRPRAMRRRSGEPLERRLQEWRELEVDLNVLAFVTMILPPEIVEAPPHGSLCFHPSLLPKYRGGNALAWQIILGETESGVTVFRPDAGVDTGPIVVQKGGVAIEPHHTAASLYFEKLYALGVEAMVEAVEQVDRGEATFTPQDEARASFQGLVDDAVAQVDWSRPAAEVDRLLRGCDPSPGAWATLEGERVRLYDARLLDEDDPGAPPGAVLALEEGGAAVLAASGGRLRVGRVRRGEGKKLPAAEAGLAVGARLA